MTDMQPWWVAEGCQTHRLTRYVDKIRDEIVLADGKKLEFWDLVERKKLKELNFGEPIVAVRVTTKYCIVVLVDRTISLAYTQDSETGTINLGIVKALYRTAKNP